MKTKLFAVRRFFPCVIVLIAAIGMTGCARTERKTAVASGEITLDGEPIEYGSITFYPESPGGQEGGGIIENGRYTAKVPPGRKIIRVRGMKQDGVAPPAEGDTTRTEIPVYKQTTNDKMHWNGSAFSVDVGSDDLTLDIALTKDSVLKNEPSP